MTESKISALLVLLTAVAVAVTALRTVSVVRSLRHQAADLDAAPHPHRVIVEVEYADGRRTRVVDVMDPRNLRAIQEGIREIRSSA